MFLSLAVAEISSTGCSPSDSPRRQKAWEGAVSVTALAANVDCSWQFVAPDDNERYITFIFHSGIRMGTSNSRRFTIFACGDSYCDRDLGAILDLTGSAYNQNIKVYFEGDRASDTFSLTPEGVFKWTLPARAKAWMIKVTSRSGNGRNDEREEKGFDISFKIHGAQTPAPTPPPCCSCDGCTDCGSYTGTSWAISDGSESNYARGANCEWMFTASNPSAAVKITFSSIDLFWGAFDIFKSASDRDRVEVYECTTNDCSEKILLHSLYGTDFIATSLRDTDLFPFDVLGSTPVVMVKFITSDPSARPPDEFYTGFDATFSEIAQASSEPPAPRISNFGADLGSLFNDLLSRKDLSAVVGNVGDAFGSSEDATPIQNSSDFSIIAALTAAPLYIVETNEDTLEIPDPVVKDPEWQLEVFIEAITAGSGVSNGIAFSDYEVAVTPTSPVHPPYSAPAWSWCTPGVDCPPGGDTCSYGYPYNGWKCASGCSQQAGSGPAQCSQSTCCSCTARPPSNGQIMKPGESFVSQVRNPHRLSSQCVCFSVCLYVFVFVV